MTQIVLRCSSDPSAGPCGLCGQPVVSAGGTHLMRTDGEPVCGECGRKHAPALAALAGLADAAQRIGRIGRHSVFPPLTALLDLASAAEKYTAAAPPPPSRAEAAS
jgi:hypothetical protein